MGENDGEKGKKATEEKVYNKTSYPQSTWSEFCRSLEVMRTHTLEMREPGYVYSPGLPTAGVCPGDWATSGRGRKVFGLALGILQPETGRKPQIFWQCEIRFCYKGLLENSSKRLQQMI